MTADGQARKLRGLISIEKGKPPLTQPYHGSDAEVYLTPQLLRGRVATGETVKPGSRPVRAKQGDTIVIWDGANSGEILLGRPGVVPSTMARINHDPQFQPRYFYYALKRWEHYLKAQTSGSRVQHVDRELLENLEILEMPAQAQNRISDTLTAVDLAIEQTERLVAKQGLIRAGLLVDLLTKGVDEAGEIRTEDTHDFRDSAIGRIPADWEVSALGSVADISSGVTLGGQHSGPNTVELPYLRVANVQDGYLDLREVKIIRVPSASVNKYLLRPGDVLMNEGGDFDKLGRGTVWRGEIDQCLHQTTSLRCAHMRACSTRTSQRPFRRRRTGSPSSFLPRSSQPTWPRSTRRSFEPSRYRDQSMTSNFVSSKSCISNQRRRTWSQGNSRSCARCGRA